MWHRKEGRAALHKYNAFILLSPSWERRRLIVNKEHSFIPLSPSHHLHFIRSLPSDNSLNPWTFRENFNANGNSLLSFLSFIFSYLLFIPLYSRIQLHLLCSLSYYIFIVNAFLISAFVFELFRLCTAWPVQPISHAPFPFLSNINLYTGHNFACRGSFCSRRWEMLSDWFYCQRNNLDPIQRENSFIPCVKDLLHSLHGEGEQHVDPRMAIMVNLCLSSTARGKYEG